MKKFFFMVMALGLVVTSVATAQEHPAEGFHQPEPMRWSPFSPSRIEVAGHDGRTVSRDAPAPFVGPLFNFGLLLVLGYMALTRSINPALTARREAIEAELATAKRLHDEAQALHSEYASRAENLAAELDALKAEFVRAGEAERDKIIAEAKAQAERLRADGVRSLEHEAAAMRDDLRRDAVLAAAEAAERVVRAAITPADQTRLADDFMNGLEKEARA